jgi:tetratricopeptide (TPR) repeat protein
MTIEKTLETVTKLLDDGQPEKATVAIAESAPELSQDPRALLTILDGLDRQRKDETIAPLLAKLQELNLLTLECTVFDMRLKFRGNKFGEALKAVDKILRLSGEHVEALRTGGRIGNLTRDENLSLRYWERLAKASGSDAEAPLQAARIHLRLHQYPQALNWAYVAAQRRPDAGEPLQIAVTAGLEVGWPESCDAMLIGLFRMNRERALKPLERLAQELDSESGARLFAKLQQAYPSDQAIGDVISKAYSKWLVAALEQELASRELEAAAFYRAAKALRPGDPNAQGALERLSSPSLLAMRDAFNSRDFAGAIEHGAMAARINPECFEAWQTIGRAQFTRGSLSEAGEAFRRCTELDGKDAQSWLNYGLVLNQSGERPDALRAFQTARSLGAAEVKREADASIAALHPLLVREAHQAAAEGNIEYAWQSTDAALAIKRDDASVGQLRRNLLRQQQNLIREAWNTGSDSVVALCRSYLEKVPCEPYVSTVLGRTLMRARAYQEALPIWEALSRQSPQESHNHLQVARCCRSLRMRDRGLAAAESALRIDPNLQEAADLANLFRAMPGGAGQNGMRR